MTDCYEAALRDAFTKDEQRLWLIEIVNRLSGRPVRKCHEVLYWNHPGLPEHLRVQGYYACYQSVDRNGYPIYLMIGRSHTNEHLNLDQIIDDLGSSTIVFPFEKFGDYYAQRSRRGPGKHATIKFGNIWYMLSVCGHLKPHYRLVRRESVIASKSVPFEPEITFDLGKLRESILAVKSKRD